MNLLSIISKKNHPENSNKVESHYGIKQLKTVNITSGNFFPSIIRSTENTGSKRFSDFEQN